jgi:hypothetical protein
VGRRGAQPPLDDDVWELYDTTKDWSQAHDLAPRCRRSSPSCSAVRSRGSKYNVFPLDDRKASDEPGPRRPAAGRARQHAAPVPRHAPAGENTAINIKNKSHSVTAELEVPSSGAKGVIIAQGGHMGGWSLWAGKSLPSEAQWEYAAWGGLEDSEFAWGDELELGGRHFANVWQGEFPWQNLQSDGFERTSPVGFYGPNGFGLIDMIGNVWEWTDDWYRARHPEAKDKPCCIPSNPRGGPKSDSHDRCGAIAIPRKALKGGSHLCAPNYCRRYRPAARHAQPIDTSASHIGFRCVSNALAQDQP